MGFSLSKKIRSEQEDRNKNAKISLLSLLRYTHL
jgi:hypothetical protein